jgi:hypothetical protein
MINPLYFLLTFGYILGLSRCISLCRMRGNGGQCGLSYYCRMPKPTNKNNLYTASKNTKLLNIKLMITLRILMFFFNIHSMSSVSLVTKN